MLSKNCKLWTNKSYKNVLRSRVLSLGSEGLRLRVLPRRKNRRRPELRPSRRRRTGQRRLQERTIESLFRQIDVSSQRGRKRQLCRMSARV
jgi:hypothetical protein